MEITIHLVKEDIETSSIGLHYQIRTNKGISINFTPEAFEELENDIKEIRRIENLVDDDRPIKD